MDKALLTRYSHGEATTDLLLALTRSYPRWAAPAIELLRDEDADLDAATRERLRATVALNCTDLDNRAALTADLGAVMARFYPAQKSGATATTDDAIATFLETYGHSSPEEDRLLEQMIFNPVPDYGAVLAVDEETPDDAAAAFVEAFMKAPEETPEPEPEKKAAPAPKPAPAPRAESSLSESLAKIYIKQGRYNKAYEIILSLYLNNPKKSIYFADQLRFLRKLMLNSRYDTKQNQ